MTKPKNISVCVNADCPFTECVKHPVRVCVSNKFDDRFDFDGYCERYEKYLLRQIKGRRNIDF